MRYYYMSGGDDERYGIAYVPKGTPLFLLPISGLVETWEPIVLTLREGDFSDYLSSDLGCRLCSVKLRDILDRSSSEFDELQWLPATVRSERGQEEEYFMLHFPQGLDVLDKEKTIFGAYDTIIKPVISRKLAEKHHVFTFIGSGGYTLFISEQVKNNIEAGNCVGMAFEEAASRD